jgi:hypothetical protein
MQQHYYVYVLRSFKDKQFYVGFTLGKAIRENEAQELSHGVNDVSTTMIYTHVLNRGGKGVFSPADRL